MRAGGKKETRKSKDIDIISQNPAKPDSGLRETHCGVSWGGGSEDETVLSYLPLTISSKCVREIFSLDPLWELHSLRGEFLDQIICFSYGRETFLILGWQTGNDSEVSLGPVILKSLKLHPHLPFFPASLPHPSHLEVTEVLGGERRSRLAE